MMFKTDLPEDKPMWSVTYGCENCKALVARVELLEDLLGDCQKIIHELVFDEPMQPFQLVIRSARTISGVGQLKSEIQSALKEKR